MARYQVILIVHHAECVTVEGNNIDNADDAIAIAKNIAGPKFNTIKIETIRAVELQD